MNTSLEVSEFSEVREDLVVIALGPSQLGDIQIEVEYINGTANGTLYIVCC